MPRYLYQPIGTVLGIGHVPFIPATWTSLAVALAFWAAGPLSLPVQGALLLLVTALGIPACGGLEREYGKDPRQATVDEAAGMLLTLFAVPPVFLDVMVAFVLFRIFDVLKPFPGRRAEGLPGGWGIMTDDLVAGVYGRLAMMLWLAWGPWH